MLKNAPIMLDIILALLSSKLKKQTKMNRSYMTTCCYLFIVVKHNRSIYSLLYIQCSCLSVKLFDNGEKNFSAVNYIIV